MKHSKTNIALILQQSLQPSTPTLHLGTCPEDHTFFLVSLGVMLSASAVLTTTTLKWVELFKVHMYLGLKISPFFWRGTKKLDGLGRPGHLIIQGPIVFILQQNFNTRLLLWQRIK